MPCVAEDLGQSLRGPICLSRFETVYAARAFPWIQEGTRPTLLREILPHSIRKFVADLFVTPISRVSELVIQSRHVDQ